MQLERLCDRDLAYQHDSLHDTSLVLVRPYDGKAGVRFGLGEGEAKGDRLRGRVRWFSHPRWTEYVGTYGLRERRYGSGAECK